MYVPLVVLMLVKNLNAREMEAYVSENVVARVFMGRQDDPSPQIRDHSNIARAYTALGKDGVDEVNALMLHVAHDCGFADASLVRYDGARVADWVSQRTRILRGWAQRCGRALTQLKTRAVLGVDTRAGADDPQDGQRPSPVYQEPSGQATGVDAPAHRSRPVGGADAAHSDAAGQRRDRVRQRDHHLKTHARRSGDPADRAVDHDGVVAKGKIVHAGVTQTRALVRHKAGRSGVWLAVSAQGLVGGIFLGP